jgi:hypothetical protein
VADSELKTDAVAVAPACRRRLEVSVASATDGLTMDDRRRSVWDADAQPHRFLSES